MAERAYSLLVEPDQWARCAHHNTALLDGGGVELTWTTPPTPRSDPCDKGSKLPSPRGDEGSKLPSPRGDTALSGGLVFDDQCRAYRSRPDLGRVDLVSDTVGSACPGTLRRPAGLAVDADQRLYVVDAGTAMVHVVDLRSLRPLRRIHLGAARLLDVAAHGRGALVLTDRLHRLVFVEGRNPPVRGPDLVRPCFPPGLHAIKVAPGPLILWRRPDGLGVIARPDGTSVLELSDAHDIDADDETIVVGGGPDRPIRRFRLDPAGAVELEPLEAFDHDGTAVAIAPNGRVAFTVGSGSGVGWTSGSAAAHAREGWVVSYRMDSGAYRTRWGRVFLDACAPIGTSVGLRFITTDDDTVAGPIAASTPDRGTHRIPHQDASPPLPPEYLLEDALHRPAVALYHQPVSRRQPGDAPGADADFDVYEAPVHAAPGRYLWVQIVLTGTERTSPKVRAVRIERPGHDLLGSLPRAWSRREPDADFLFRLLAPAEGLLHELDERAAVRHLLLSPDSTPSDALPWLASFAGLTVDSRWPEHAQRTLIGEAYALFRRRGTAEFLIRLVEIYLGRRPTVIEQWQLRGLSGIELGTEPLRTELAGAPAVSGSARATGTLGRVALGENGGNSSTYAHRFTVLVPGTLTAEQRDVIDDILAQHRPAHTASSVCELGDGMLVGYQSRVGVSSYVGPCRRDPGTIVGQTCLGGDNTLGSGAVGGSVGVSATVGQVRVG